MQAEDRYLRIYCPTHALSFTALGAGTVMCAGGGEILAQAFPPEEFWEYCCDCQSFRPSSFARGGKAQERCSVCSRTHTKRYVCDRCKVISLDSDEEMKRKAYSITGQGKAEPSCPGCLKITEATVSLHDCDEINAQFSTARDACPFCHEQLSRPQRHAQKTLRFETDTPDVISAAARAQDARPLTCARCGTAATPENRFCKECGYALSGDEVSQGEVKVETSTQFAPAISVPQATPTLPSTIPTVPYYSVTAPTDSGRNYTEAASTRSVTRPLLIAALVLAILVIGVLSVLLLQVNSRTEIYANANTDRVTSSTPGPSATASNSKKAATSPTPTATPTAQPSPATAQSGPTANARLAYCRNNNVYVRSSPYLDESKANVIKVINRDQKMWVLSTSNNYDTTYIRSAGGNVTDNWTEVQLYDDASVRGWVFSYFIQY